MIFRDYLSSVTENWLLYFGLLFVAFIVFSPTGLVGWANGCSRRSRKTVVEAAAMAGRKAGDRRCPPS